MVSDPLIAGGSIDILCLNPCFSGRWSLTQLAAADQAEHRGLNPCFSGRWSLTANENANAALAVGLNPCFSGRWSLTTIPFVSTRNNITS